MLPASNRYRLSSVGYAPESSREPEKVIVKLVRGDFSGNAVHEKSWLANPHATLMNVLFTAFNFGLKLVSELELILQKIVEPITKFLLLVAGQHSNLGFKLLDCFHSDRLLTDFVKFVKYGHRGAWPVAVLLGKPFFLSYINKLILNDGRSTH